MAKILESLSAFESKSINQLEMKNVIGGIAAGVCTDGGTRTIYNGGCAVVHCTFTSDETFSNGVKHYYGETCVNA